MKIISKGFLILFFYSVMPGPIVSQAQKANSIGLFSELLKGDYGSSNMVNKGVFLEKWLSKKIVFETGFSFKKYPFDGSSFNSIPVCLKYDLSFFSLGVGLSLDFPNESRSNFFDIEYGFFGKISKDLPLSERVVFEPSFILSFQEGVGSWFAGLGLRLKYLL